MNWGSCNRDNRKGAKLQISLEEESTGQKRERFSGVSGEIFVEVSHRNVKEAVCKMLAGIVRKQKDPLSRLLL